LQRDLAAHGINVGICRIRRIRKKLGIRCKQVKKFKATTDSRHRFPVAENLLKQQFTVDAGMRSGQRSDSTYRKKAGSTALPTRTFQR
jgi:transposase InsO family protein